MPVIILLLSFVVFSSSLYAQDVTAVPTALTQKDFDLQGDVAKVYSIMYSISLQDRVMPDSTVFVDTMLAKSREVNMQFDSLGHLLNRKVDSFDAGGKLIVHTENRYYFDGDRLAAMVWFADGKMKDSVSIAYSRKGDIDELAMYDRRGKLQGYVEYFYRNGRVFNVKERDETCALVRFIRMGYDSWGRLTEKQILNNSMHCIATRTIAYDTMQTGDIQVNEYTYAEDDVLSGMVGRIVDKRGFVTEVTIIDSNKRMERQSTYSYNANGVVASELTFTMVKEDYTYLYEYDEQDNWKTRRTYTDDLPVGKTHRVVEYAAVRKSIN